MWNKQPTNSNILTPRPPKNGFIVDGKKGDLMFAVVPYKNKLMIIHLGEQLKVCNNGQSARNYIKKYKNTRKYKNSTKLYDDVS